MTENARNTSAARPRRSFCARLAARTVRPHGASGRQESQEVQQILGHASIRTTIDVSGTPSVEAVQDEYEKKIAGMY